MANLLSGEKPGFISTPEAFGRIDPEVDQIAYGELLERTRQAARLALGDEPVPESSANIRERGFTPFHDLEGGEIIEQSSFYND